MSPDRDLGKRLAEIVDPDGLRDFVDMVDRWSEAYPITAFPEPRHDETGHDPTLCSASMGRHVFSRIVPKMGPVRAVLSLTEEADDE